MDRKFLFRAWHKAHKKYYEVLSILPNMRLIQLKGLNNAIPLSCLELEQYINEPDIEGNPIYEGDVLQSEIGDKHTWIVKYENGAYWIFQNAWIKSKRKKENYLQELCCKDNIEFYQLKKIGTIHED